MDLLISHDVSITTWDGEIPYTPFCMHGGIDSKPRLVLAWVHEEGTWLVVCIWFFCQGSNSLMQLWLCSWNPLTQHSIQLECSEDCFKEMSY
jgi:hypothetical protein